MKTKLLLFLTSFSLLGFGQTPISNYDSAPLSMYAIVTSGTAIDQSASGADLTWTFNNFTQTGNSSDTQASPTAQELIDYPGTTSVATTTRDASVAKVFLKNIANTISRTGVDGEGLILSYITDNALIGTFPLSYGYSNTDNVSGTFSYNGTISGTFTGTSISEIDAYGTLIMNDLGSGAFNGSVTRLKTIQNIVLYAGFITGTADQISFYYYNAATGDLVFRTNTVTINAPGTNSTDTIMESLLSSALGVNHNIFNNDLQLFPNPVTTRLNLNLDNDMDVKSITVLDINGRQVLHSEVNLSSLNVSTLKSGVYFVSIHTNRGVVNKKIIKL